MRTPEHKPVLGKVEAAERQLNTAVWLWFNEGDIVSIHSLTGAAFGIIDGLFQHRWKRRPIPFSSPPKGMTQRDWINLLQAAQAFAKHSRNDPNDVREYSSASTMRYLFYAIVAFVALTDGDYDSHKLLSIFVLYFRVTTPKLRSQIIHISYEGFSVEELQKLSRAEFFERLGGDFRGHPPRPDLST